MFSFFEFRKKLPETYSLDRDGIYTGILKSQLWTAGARIAERLLGWLQISISRFDFWAWLFLWFTLCVNECPWKIRIQKDHVLIIHSLTRDSEDILFVVLYVNPNWEYPVRNLAWSRVISGLRQNSQLWIHLLFPADNTWWYFIRAVSNVPLKMDMHCLEITGWTPGEIQWI